LALIVSKAICVAKMQIRFLDQNHLITEKGFQL